MRLDRITIDPSMLWVGAALAVLAAVLLAFIPRLPSAGGAQGFGLSGGSPRVTVAANRKLRIFAIVQIAASFVLVASAAASVKTLLSLEIAQTGFDTRDVLAVNVPVIHNGKTPSQIVSDYQEAARRIRALPGIQNVAIGTKVPWRDAGDGDFALQLSDRRARASAERASTPRGPPDHHALFFATLGLPVSEGRDFNDGDRNGSEPAVIVSQSAARRLFPTSDALGHHLRWTDPILDVVPFIVGVVPHIDDINVVPKPTMTVYRPFDQEALLGGGRLFVQTRSNPYTLVTPITRIMHQVRGPARRACGHA